ncbi:MAG: DUF4364 family protein [Saccharofermentans sp.]|nr:DUF4364 family protein [Saccharofermentans sp.]
MADITVVEAKIQILYLVSEAPGVSYHMLMDHCLNSLYSDFFTFSQAYNELIAGNLMDVTGERGLEAEALGGTEKLYITDGGRAVLNDLKPSLNIPLIMHLDSASKELKSEVEESMRANAVVNMAEGGKYTVTLFYENEGLPFNATITCKDEAQAKRISRAWSGAKDAAIDSLLKALGE